MGVIMDYNKDIVSKESVETVNRETNKNVMLEVGRKYIFYMSKPTTKKDIKDNGRIVEILGFDDNFMCNKAIVRYMDTQRPGSISNIDYLLPYQSSFNSQE